jgi:hypothetical protein
MKQRDTRTLDRSVEAACRKYERALSRGRSNPRADGKTREQLENFRQGIERMACRTTQMKQLICSRGVPLIQFVSYRSFTQHVDKITREYRGEALRNLALIAIDRWLAYGLNRDVLLEICAQIFNLDLSAPAPPL